MGLIILYLAWGAGVRIPDVPLEILVPIGILVLGAAIVSIFRKKKL